MYMSSPHLGDDELRLVRDAFESNWIAPLGPHVDGFEREVCARIGMAHGAALSSGTAALHLALVLLGVERGDEVVCSSLTFAASANPIAYQGATPVFIDSEERSWNMDPALLEDELAAAAKRGKLPKAVIIVDLYGQCADYDAIEAACARHDVPLVEDAAEALGASYRGRPAGSFGAMSVLSFNGNKIITTSGGGMLLSNSKERIDRARFLATQARDLAPHYEHSTVGYNYRLSNVCAAIGRGQLRSLDDRVRRRRANNAFYKEALADLSGLRFMPEADWGQGNSWLTVVTVDPEAFGATREDLRRRLEAEDIEGRPVWKPMHLQPVFAGARVRGGEVSERLFERGLCLPSGSNLSSSDLERVVAVVRSARRG
jgi:pyridoxal phosphate-dependent aminotransferase EpsN